MLAEQVGVKTAKAAITTATTTELVAAVSGKSIMIVGLFMAEGAAVDTTVILQDDAGSPVQLIGKTGAAIALSKSGAVGAQTVVLPWNPGGWGKTTSGKALDCVSTGTTPDLFVLVQYVEI